MNEKVLCVDDDPMLLSGLQRSLGQRFTIETALDGRQAMSLIESGGPYAVLIADLYMPVMNGLELLGQAQRVTPDTVRFMLTGDNDCQTAINAVNQGAIFRFLAKPCSHETMSLAIDAGLQQYRLVRAERDLLEKTFNGSVTVLTEMLSMVEPEVFGLSQKLRDYARLMAPVLDMDQNWTLEAAAMLSQIGYVTIPLTLTQKLRANIPLKGTEEALVNRIPEISAKILANIPRLENVAKIVLYQNKCFDGSGFPADRISGENIPLGARVLRVLIDLIDLESKGNPRTRAFDELRRRTGSYDPRICQLCFMRLVNNWDGHSSPAGKAVALHELQEGVVLLSAIETKDGTLVVPSGLEVTPMLLEKLNNFAQLRGIKEPIYVSA